MGLRLRLLQLLQRHERLLRVTVYRSQWVLSPVLYLLAWVLRSLNWRLVRAIGELQILTRISYAALIVVPLLASFWPGISATTAAYNRTRHRSAERIYESLEHIQL